MNPKIKKLWKRTRAVSPVIAVILMVAITVVIASVVYAWTNGMLSTNDKPLATSIGIRDAVPGNKVFYIDHNGGDTVTNALYVNTTNATKPICSWNYMEVRINGNAISGTYPAANTYGSMNCTNATYWGSGSLCNLTNFGVGDFLKFNLGAALASGDIISVIYMPANYKLAEKTVK